MAIKRHESQAYADVASVQAETLVPDPNDVISIESLQRSYNWIEASILAEDGTYVIKQASIATGRWIASHATNVYNGTAAVLPIALDNGQQTTEIITVTGVTLANANIVLPSVTATGDVFVTSASVVADDTVQVVVYNNSGVTISITALSVQVHEL